MPIPFIPSEIVSEIVFHLQIGGFIDDEAGQVEAGKMIALVCRRWRSIGQALRWRTIKLLPLQIPSLVDHFHEFPQLALFLRKLRVKNSFSNNEEEEDQRERRLNAEALAQLPRLLAFLNNLRGTIIADILGEHLPPILRSLSKRPKLRGLAIRSDKVEWSSELATIFRDGFDKLTSFTFASSALILSTQIDIKPEALHPKLRLLNLKLRFDDIRPSDNAGLDSQLFSIVDPTALRTLQLMGDLVCHQAFRWIASCPRLVSLHVLFLPDQIRPGFSNLINALPRLLSLKSMTAELWLPEESFTISPLALSIVLASFPPTLLHLEANSFIFSDYRSLPPGTLPSEDVPKLTALCPSDGAGGEPAQLLVWSVDEEGSHRWYHQVVTED